MREIGRILLVEDDPRDVELIREGLADAHVANELDVVEDGAEALDFLFRRGRFAGRAPLAPAVVLLDLKLPRVSGHEVLRQIRAAPELRRLPVVILTASREESDLARGYDAGTNAYVVKPLKFLDFIAAIRALGIFWGIVNEPPPPRSAP